jgi:GNAT superfamily N-acetyltransferase
MRLALVSQELRSLLLESFGKEDYLESFPQVFGRTAIAQHFEVHSNGKLAAFAASIPFHWHAQGQRITGHCVGSVCSHPEFRGKGFALKAIVSAEIYARNVGADFIFLFSDLDEFYKKAGYSSYGDETFAPLAVAPEATAVAKKNLKQLIRLADIAGPTTQNIYHHTQTSSTTEIPASTLAAIWNFVEQHSHKSENSMSFSEFLTLMTIPNVEIHWLEKNGVFQSLLFIGKGADFTNVAHSVSALGNSALANLLSLFFQATPQRQLLLMIPPALQSIGSQLATAGTPAFYAKQLVASGLRADLIRAVLLNNNLYPRTFQSI